EKPDKQPIRPTRSTGRDEKEPCSHSGLTFCRSDIRQNIATSQCTKANCHSFHKEGPRGSPTSDSEYHPVRAIAFKFVNEGENYSFQVIETGELQRAPMGKCSYGG